MKTLAVFLMTLSSATAACGPNDFVQVDGPTASIQTQGMSYSPRCLKVKPGTAVTISASRMHPLQGIQNRQGPANPFHRGQETTDPDTQTLNEAGRFGFFCVRHGDSQGNGMAGEILVE